MEVEGLLRGVAELLSPRAREKDLEIAWAAPAAPVSVHADEGRLRQILLNFAGNAVKFTEDGRRPDRRLGSPAGPPAPARGGHRPRGLQVRTASASSRNSPRPTPRTPTSAARAWASPSRAASPAPWAATWAWRPRPAAAPASGSRPPSPRSRRPCRTKPLEGRIDRRGLAQPDRPRGRAAADRSLRRRGGRHPGPARGHRPHQARRRDPGGRQLWPRPTAPCARPCSARPSCCWPPTNATASPATAARASPAT